MSLPYLYPNRTFTSGQDWIKEIGWTLPTETIQKHSKYIKQWFWSHWTSGHEGESSLWDEQQTKQVVQLPQLTAQTKLPGRSAGTGAPCVEETELGGREASVAGVWRTELQRGEGYPKRALEICRGALLAEHPQCRHMKTQPWAGEGIIPRG